MPLHRLELAESTNIKQAYEAISACGRHDMALWIPFASVDDGLVRVPQRQHGVKRWST